MTAGNVIAQLGLVYQKAASDKSAILNKPDLKFFVSNKTAALYRQALATAGAVDNAVRLKVWLARATTHK